MFKMIDDPLKFFSDLVAEGEPYKWFSFLGTKCLVLNDADAVGYVFQDNFENYRKSKFHKSLRPLLGEGIFLSEGDLWKKQRKETAPFFAGKYFPQYINDMLVCARKMSDRIGKKVKTGSAVDINVECMWFTLDVVLLSLFKDDRESTAHNMRDSLGLLLKDAEERIWSLVSVPQSIKMKYFPQYRDALAFLNHTVSDLVEYKRADSSECDDFINTLISRYDESSDIERELLRDQILSFLLAGHETSANALTWALLEVAKSPALRAEAVRNITDVDMENLTPESFHAMSFIRSIFEESLRLYPPVWTMSRESNARDSIPFSTGETVPIGKNQIVMISPYTLHRNRRYWKDPKIFDPSRFMPENAADIVKYSYIPYGGGPRLCLGHKFANFEGMIALLRLLNDYDFSCTQEFSAIRPEPLITLRPDRSVMLHFTARTSQQNVRHHSFA